MFLFDLSVVITNHQMLPILELLDPRIWLWILHWDVGRVRDAPHHQNSQVRFFCSVGGVGNILMIGWSWYCCKTLN